MIPIFAKSREEFPALRRAINGRPAVYFDGPAGSQVPQRVIDAVSGYFSSSHFPSLTVTITRARW